jgi:hypothetical protein
MSVAAGPDIVEDGLVLALDAGNIRSYPGSGSSWIDISSNNKNFTLSGGPSFTTLNGISCADKTGSGKISNTSMPNLGNNYTLMSWAYSLTDAQTSDWRTLFRTDTDEHPILIQNTTNLIGMWDGTFRSYGITADNYEGKWTCYTAVGIGGSSQTLYLNDGSVNASVNYNSTGEALDYIGGDVLGYQNFGYVATAFFYDKSLSQLEVKQNYNALKSRFGL